jgi:hypothetical protein
MGTNYYRIPTVEEMEDRKEILVKQVSKLDLSVGSISNSFRTPRKMDTWDEQVNPWERFTDDMQVHLGKRSGGWKFLWNFNDNKYYSNKEELLQFIRSGRVINEYSEEIPVEEFIQMALDWGQPDGYDTQTYYEKNPNDRPSWFDWRRYGDLSIDGLRVSSSTEFS